jgi:hypothetical protein
MPSPTYTRNQHAAGWCRGMHVSAAPIPRAPLRHTIRAVAPGPWTTSTGAPTVARSVDRLLPVLYADVLSPAGGDRAHRRCHAVVRVATHNKPDGSIRPRKIRMGKSKHLQVMLAVASLAVPNLGLPASDASEQNDSLTVERTPGNGLVIDGIIKDLREDGMDNSQLWVFRSHCGATIIEMDANSRFANPSAQLDKDGHFTIRVSEEFLTKKRMTGVKGSVRLPEADLREDYLVIGTLSKSALGFEGFPGFSVTGGGIGLLKGVDQQALHITYDGKIVSPLAASLSTTEAPSLVITFLPPKPGELQRFTMIGGIKEPSC